VLANLSSQLRYLAYVALGIAGSDDHGVAQWSENMRLCHGPCCQQLGVVTQAGCNFVLCNVWCDHLYIAPFLLLRSPCILCHQSIQPGVKHMQA
jgi:hypothetical protein